MQKILHFGEFSLPALGIGTYNLTGREGEKAIEYALAAGYRHIDTAEFYGNEQEVGNALRGSGIDSREVFITTKVWPSNFTKKHFVPCVEDSLRKLKVDTIDLLLLHWPADDETNKLAAGLLNECYSKQYIKHAGVSNFTLVQLRQIQHYTTVYCNQLEYNPYKNAGPMLEYLQQNSLLLTAYSPLARGAVLREPVIQTLAEKYNKTGSQVVLRWLLQQDNVAAIPKASSKKHCLENMDVFDFNLSGAEMQDIFNLHKL